MLLNYVNGTQQLAKVHEALPGARFIMQCTTACSFIILF